MIGATCTKSLGQLRRWTGVAEKGFCLPPTLRGGTKEV